MLQGITQSDEIDLGEVFGAVWHNLRIVAVSSFLVFVLSVYYAFAVATPEYQASTRFELLENDTGPALGQAAGLASLAGLSLPGTKSEAKSLADRILSRPFIASVFEDAGFAGDVVFNPELAEPGFLGKVKRFLLGPDEEDPLSKEDHYVAIIEELAERMQLLVRENGIISLIIRHPDPQRAADIANVIALRAIQDIFERKRSEDRASLEYFSGELLQVRADLDAANSAVRDFAVKNNLQSAEDLAKTSIQLSQLRRDLATLDQSLLALEDLQTIGAEAFDGPEFALKHSVSTTLSFRRLLGLSTQPIDWSLPQVSSIDRVENELNNQRTSLLGSLNALENRAISSGREALELATLQREVQVQQAIYESVITQFEAQSLFTGFEKASGRVIESAIPPHVPAKPKKLILAALGLILGGLLGVAISLVLSTRRGTLYGARALQDAFGLAQAFMMTLRLKGGDINAPLSKKQSVLFRDMLASMAEQSTKTLVLATRETRDLVRLTACLAKSASQLGDKVAILDLSGTGASLTSGHKQAVSEYTGLTKSPYLEGVDVFQMDMPSLLKSAADADKMLTYLTEAYGRVFVICPAPEQGIALSRFAAVFADSAIVLAERAKSRRSGIEKVQSVLSKSNISEPLLVVA